MFRVLSLVFVVIFLLGGICAWWLAQRALPIHDGVITLDSLMRSASIRYDDRGIPYIEASSERDLFLVQGYATASDRIFQMDLLRRTALGQMSEIFGETCLSDDKLARTIGFNRMAKDELAKLSQDSRAFLDAYCLGVNEYLEKNVQNFPIEFLILGYRPRPWEPIDTLAILKFLQYEKDESWRLDDLRQRVLDKTNAQVASTLFEQQLKSITVDASSAKPVAGSRRHSLDAIHTGLRALGRSKIHQFIDARTGSNAVAVSAALSDSKGSLIACDKHELLTMPDKYYAVWLSAPNIKLCGATIPGVPAIMVGRNDYISWGSINLKADVQDLYLEQFSSQFPNKYRAPDGWQNLKEEIEEIKVRWKKNILHKVQFTQHGPVMQRNDTTGVSFNWTGARNTPALFDALWKLNASRDWQDFQKALGSYYGNAQCFVYADRRGAVGYKIAGAVPDRRKFGGGSVLVAGWTVRQEPPLMSPSDLPGDINPKDGIVIAGEQRIPGHPSLISPYQAMRQRSVLIDLKKRGQKAGMPEMALLQCDANAPLLDLVRKSLHKAIERNELIDKYQTTALEALDKWDGQMSSDSTAATIYESFLTTACHRLLEPKIDLPLTSEYMERWPRWSVFVEQTLINQPLFWLPPSERTYDTFFITTFAQALKGARLTGSQDDPRLVPWGSLHKATFRHALTQYHPLAASIGGALFNAGPVGVSGDHNTVAAMNVTAYGSPWNFNCTTGPSLRLLIDMADADKVYQNLSLGQSGQIMSPNRTDQLKPWLSCEPHAVAFSSSQLDRQTQHKLILTKQ